MTDELANTRLAVMRGEIPRRALARLVVAVLCACVAAASALAADMDRKIDFHIAEGPLEAALLEFSKQADVPVTIAARSVGHLRTAGLNGRVSLSTALSILLEHTGLSYTTVGETITVVHRGGLKESLPKSSSDTAERLRRHG